MRSSGNYGKKESRRFLEPPSETIIGLKIRVVRVIAAKITVLE